MAGNAVYKAAQRVRDQLLRVAADTMNVPPELLELRNGQVQVTGDAKGVLTFGELARKAGPYGSLPNKEPNLEAIAYFHVERVTYSYGVAVAEVEVDTRTGVVIPKQLWIIYDVGNVINHQMATGQIHGAAAQGIGGALLEELVYDDTGQMISGSFMDYLLTTSVQPPK